MRKLLLPLVAGILVIAACKTSKKAANNVADVNSQAYKDSIAAAEMFAKYEEEAIDDDFPDNKALIELDEEWEVTAPANNKLEVYKASKTHTIDIIHTKLKVKFDYEKQYMYGKAYITLKPYFYPTDIAVLDAKGFEILGVFEIDKKKNTTPLKYEYRDLAKLEINLGRIYKANEKITIFINYVAKPNELPNGYGDAFDPTKEAITEDKGLYFINPELKEKNKPRQIWTQGETESSSCWFPTFDSPNERMTQEIFITVDTPYVTLSNGKLMSSKKNGDGTHTDHWKQTLPHAPYLAMMAVGDFTIVKDKWRNVPVHYYVEKEYAKYAKMIFGNTPKMIDFYSKKLGVDYPWDKYHQVVVRDFVSGAMENTGAVIHFDLLQHDDRMHIDQPLEEVVAHELFHHWFGDLVTIESWANIPLNESFATYGEYLWFEHAYGREEADNHLNTNLRTYLNEANNKKVPLIRFNHEKPLDMFDAHSYQKGGRVLHMLRKYVGDEAFFKALNVYLTKNKFKTVEMHQLRIAFEEVTGEDLNWFFNQWFYKAGHPVLSVIHDYDAEAGLYTIKVIQIQEGENVPKVYRLPVKIDIHNADGTKRTEDVVIDEGYEKFEFFVDTKPTWVNFDAEKMLLCEKTEVKDDAQWIEQAAKGALFMDRLEAVEQAELNSENNDSGEFINGLIRASISDKFWAMRNKGVNLIKELDLIEERGYKKRIAFMAENDKKSTVRRSALALITTVKNKEDIPLYKKLLTDSSYFVVGEAIMGLAKLDSVAAVDFAEKSYKKEKNIQMGYLYLYILGKYGVQNYMPWFEEAITERKGGEIGYLLLSSMGTHMLNGNDARVLKGLNLLESMDDGGKQSRFLVFVVFNIKEEVNKKYLPAYKALLEKRKGNTLSADEEKKMVMLNKILSKTGGLEKLEEEETIEKIED